MKIYNGESKNADFESRLQKRLEGGKFRILNEKMYGNNKLDECEISRYHEFYASQIKKWPVDPSNLIHEEIIEMLKNVNNKSKKVRNSKKSKKETTEELPVIDEETSVAKKDKKSPASNKILAADLGCGDITKYDDLNSKLTEVDRKRLIVEFYDKYPTNDRVIASELDDLPLKDESKDLVICCLSLMKRDITKAIKEIQRILKEGGVFLLAEVTSRIKSVHRFANDIEKHGFKVENINTGNKCFVVCRFSKKSSLKKERTPKVTLTPCVYKKR